MANIKELNTRIALRYDSYSNWLSAPGKDLVLLKGEVGICELPPVGKAATDTSTIIFKVGTGAKYPEGHEKAGKYVTFEDLPWSSAKAADVHSWAKASAVELINKKLVFIGGNPDGTDREIPFDYITLEEVETLTNALASRIAAIELVLEDDSNEESILVSVTDIKDRLDIIEGESDGSIKKTVSDALAPTQERIEALTRDIEISTADIASNTFRISTNTTDIKGLGTRLKKVEAFFGPEADREDGSYEHLSKALDTLVEIQDYLTDDGESAGELLNRVAQNESDIEDLQATLAEGGDFEKRVTSNEASISSLEYRAKSLESAVRGYSEEGSIKTAIETADTKASDAQNKVNSLTAIVGNENGGLVQLVSIVKNTTESMTADVANLDIRLDTTEKTLQSLIVGTDSNAKLREDINDLQSIVKTGTTANAVLRADLNTLQNLINNKDTGLAKVKAIADSAVSLATDNASRLAAIEADYLKESDNYLLSCGKA